MIAFDFNHNNYRLLLADLAKALQLGYSGEDYLSLNAGVGRGIIKVLSLFDELQVMLVDGSFDQNLRTVRIPSDKRYFILHFDDVHIRETARFKVDNELLQKTNTHHAVARLTSNVFRNTEEIPANLHIKSIKILFNEHWLKKYLGLDAGTDALTKYLSLKTESFDIEKLDAEYLGLMEALWSVHKMEPLHNIFLQNRVMLLMERFFMRLNGKMELLEGKFHLSPNDIERLMQVEQLLASDLTKTPPTIGELARITSMGNTTLKRKFRELYGDSIYAYFQKLRMQRARDLISNDGCNVKETAEAVGYQNTSNFISAFRKQFSFSPGEVARN